MSSRAINFALLHFFAEINYIYNICIILYILEEAERPQIHLQINESGRKSQERCFCISSDTFKKEMVVMLYIYVLAFAAFIVDTIFAKRLRKLDEDVELIPESKEKLRKTYVAVRGVCIASMIAFCVYMAFRLL